tara:strand:+ start:406 stop:648 length:243 start_codon:yes stop_codon:yes gene_type:complete
MPQYDFKNKETGEVKELSLRISEYDQWIADNPEWSRYHSPTSSPKLVTGVKSAMTIAGKEWENKLTAIKKNAGNTSTIKV